MSSRPFSPGKLIAELFAFLAISIVVLHYVDQAWIWMGWKPFAMCAVLPVFNAVLSKTLSILLVMVGVVAWAFTRSGPAITLIIGGVLIAFAPELILHYMRIAGCVQ